MHRGHINLKGFQRRLGAHLKDALLQVVGRFPLCLTAARANVGGIGKYFVNVLCVHIDNSFIII